MTTGRLRLLPGRAGLCRGLPLLAAGCLALIALASFVRADQEVMRP